MRETIALCNGYGRNPMRRSGTKTAATAQSDTSSGSQVTAKGDKG